MYEAQEFNLLLYKGYFIAVDANLEAQELNRVPKGTVASLKAWMMRVNIR